MLPWYLILRMYILCDRHVRWCNIEALIAFRAPALSDFFFLSVNLSYNPFSKFLWTLTLTIIGCVHIRETDKLEKYRFQTIAHKIFSIG